MAQYRLDYELSDFQLREWKRIKTGKVLTFNVTFVAVPDGRDDLAEGFTINGFVCKREKDGQLCVEPPCVPMASRALLRNVFITPATAAHLKRTIETKSEWPKHIGELWRPPVERVVDPATVYLPQVLKATDDMAIDGALTAE